MKKIIVLFLALALSLSGVFSAFAAGASSPTRPATETKVVDIVPLDPTEIKAETPTQEQDTKYSSDSKAKMEERGIDASKYVEPNIIQIEMLKEDTPEGWYYVLIETPETRKETIISDISYDEIIVARQEAEKVDERMERYVPSVVEKAADNGYKPQDCYLYSIEDWTFYEVRGGHYHDFEFPGAQVKVYPGDIQDIFICLLHRNHNTQKWEMVETSWDGKNLVFNLPKNLSPFAIICAGEKQSPKTGDNTLLWSAYASGAVILVACAGYVLLRRKKQ